MQLKGPIFMIVYDDQDMEPEYFGGEQAEDCARRRLKQVLDNWAAHLFQRIDDGERRAPETEAKP